MSGEQPADDNIYAYDKNFNLVLQADRSRLPRRANEPSGEPETLWGKINPAEMGTRAARASAAEELGIGKDSRSLVVKDPTSSSLETAAVSKRSRLAYQSVLDSVDDFEGLAYRPRTLENKESYALLLHFMQILIGDQAREVIRGATDEVISCLKDESLRDFDRKKKVADIIGEPVSDDDYGKLVNLGNKITDYSDVRELQDLDTEQDPGVAVVFDDKDSDNSDHGDDEVQDVLSEDDEISSHLHSHSDAEVDVILPSRVSKVDQTHEQLTAWEIDAFWLQRLLSRYYPDANVAQEMSIKVLDILGSDMTLGACENSLMDLFEYDKYELVKILFRNRNLVYWCTKLAKATPDDRLALESLLKKSGHAEILAQRRGNSSAISEAVMESGMAEFESDIQPRVKLKHLAPQKVIDLESLVFSEGAHLMTNKKCTLPEGSFKTDHDGFEEIVVPAPESKPFAANEKLIPIANIPDWAQAAFKNAKTLNRVQSAVYDVAFKSSENMLLCAPTGAGKTNVAMLTILHEISRNRHPVTGKIDLSAFKIIYIAPMKALVQEMVGNFSSRLTDHYGIRVAELTGDRQLTKKQIAETQIIVTTPEKWDIITRKASDRSYTQLVRLVIIDEVHLLHDERGPVIESIVSRTIRQIECTQEMVRLVGLSATLPNFSDVAHFLRVDKNVGLFHFDSSYRPCPLQQTYIGVTEKKVMKKFHKMNEIAYEKCLEQAGKNQVLVFVHSRKETVKTARSIRDMAVEKQTIASFVRQDSSSREILQNEVENCKSPELQDLISYGFAMHHAGMTRADRSLVEDLFADGHIQVLVSTATLAWGVNLPAHSVIIKGTQIYSPEKGRWTELSPQDVLQMLGRAGRPQYDTFGEGIIITAHSELQYYLSLLNTQLPIESQLVSKLPDVLNAEIVLGTISNRHEATEWLGYTYLYVRMLRSPNVYGVFAEEITADPLLEQKRVDLIHSAAVQLEKSRVIKYDRHTGKFQATDLGRICSHYYITHNSMAMYNQHLKPTMGLIELFRIFALSDEFKFIPVRDEEKPELQKLLERVPVPVKEHVDEPTSKINVLLQAYISQLKLEGFALGSDMVYITQSAGRILRAIFELCLRKGWGRLTVEVLDLCKMIDRRMWSCMSPLRQFKGISRDLTNRLEKKAYPWERMFDLNQQELGELVNNNRAGKLLHQLLGQFPRLEVQVRVQPVTRSVLKLDVVVSPSFAYDIGKAETQTLGIHSTAGEVFWVFLMDGNCDRLLYSEQLIIKPQFCTEDHHLSFTAPLFEPLPPNYFISIVSDSWLRAETRLPISFRQLIVPSKFPPHTELLDLQPRPVNALNNAEYEALFDHRGISYFNPIQTQCFSALYRTEENTFIGAPTGSGKTVCAELAIMKFWSTHAPGEKIAYIAPLIDICEERALDWTRRLGLLGIRTTMLVGDNSSDLKSISTSDLIIATPENWDLVTRRWKQRKHIQNIGLFIADEAHMIGSHNGPVYEIVVSRMRFMASQLEKNIRIIALSSSLGNARDLGEWIGCSASSIFNFHPNVRPIPLEIHMLGFSVTHFASLMLAMSKPAFNAISQYCCSENNSLGAIVFVASRKQCILTAGEIVALSRAESWRRKFLHIPDIDLSQVAEDDLEYTADTHLDPYIKQISDQALKDLLCHGVGFVHESMSARDKLVVLRMYSKGIIQVLVASREVYYGIFDLETGGSITAHLVVIMGVQYYDGHEHRYLDYSLPEVLQMCGKACRGDNEQEVAEESEQGGMVDTGISRVFLLCPQQKKDFYKKFLYEGLPVESHLDHGLHDHFNAEIVTKTIENKQDAVDYLTWTFLYRRMGQNPNYYNLAGTGHRHISDHLSELIEATVTDLANSKCIAVEDDEMTLTPLNLGLIAAYYYVSYVTMEIFSMSLTASTKMRGLLEIVASASEYESIPIRHHEDVVLQRLYDMCPMKSAKAPRFGDSPTKANILLQSHMSRIDLPSDLASDLNVILKKILPLLYASIDVISSNGWLGPALVCMELCQMIVQAMWGDRESLLRQLPHFDTTRIELARKCGVETVFDLLEVDDESVRNQILEGLNKSQIADIAKVANRYPNVDMSYSLAVEAREGEMAEDKEMSIAASASETVSVTITLERDHDEEEEQQQPVEPVIAPHFPVAKNEGWWVVIAHPESKQLLSIKRLNNLQHSLKCQLEFAAPEASGHYDYKLYLMCDSWLGCDQEYSFHVSVDAAMEV